MVGGGHVIETGPPLLFDIYWILISVFDNPNEQS